MAKADVKQLQLQELLYQALETEMGGAEIYRTALTCAAHEELQEEWQRYLEETEEHVETLREIFDVLDLDADAETPGRAVVRHIGESLVKAMQLALENGKRAAAELVAAECVVHAETRDHLNWELLGSVLKDGKIPGELRDALATAYRKIEEQEDEHLYHTIGWTRELWIQSLGMPAVLPPPEEEREVKSAVAAARAKKSRKEFL
jgi:bacterioferritin (cytochrome b1)